MFIITEVYPPSTPQRLEAYKMLCKRFENGKKRESIATLLMSAHQLLSFEADQGGDKDIDKPVGLEEELDQARQLVTTQSGIEIFFRYLEKPGVGQKITNKLMDIGSWVLQLKGKELNPTVLNLAMALENIVAINLLTGRGVSIYLPDRTIHIDPV